MTQDSTQSGNHHFSKWHSVANLLPSPPVNWSQAPEGERERQLPAYRGEAWKPTCPLMATLHPAGELMWGVDETLAQLEKVLHLYRSGQYLQNSTAGSTAGE